MRIGDLVEHQDNAGRGQFLDRWRGQRFGFEIETLVHGIRRQPCRDRIGPHDVGRGLGTDMLLGQPALRDGQPVRYRITINWSATN